MTHSEVNFSTGLPETELPQESAELRSQLAQALEQPVAERRARLAALVQEKPTFLDGWARLSETADDAIESYAYARVGYHRGLDALRKSGWRGSGYVRWSSPGNQGFLRCLESLRRRAADIGEADEAERCAMFLRQCDPDWKPELLSS